jgi:hypothetical protein
MRAMVELWQAILLLGAGTVLGLGAGYVQRWWSRSDALQSERREAIRQHRRERIQPVRDFLVLARRFAAVKLESVILPSTVESLYSQLPEEFRQETTLESFRQRLLGSLGTGPDFPELGRSYLAACAAVPATGPLDALFEAFTATAEVRDRATWAEAIRAIGAMEDAVERYITEV